MRCIFDFKGKCVFICKLLCQSLTYSLLDAFIKVMNDLVTFHGEDNVFLTSFSSLLRGQNLPIEQWTASTVDQILTKRNLIYLDANESRSIPDTQTLSLNCLPNLARQSIQSNNLNDLNLNSNVSLSTICL